ncbi:MAG: hypothetical protein KJO35_03500 [Gammaproteobacteria bacterium]|nr:hypothetical protein [Gammaproteobacteria bacterium]NNF66452.1 hypothetical protein [Gammaproteobacteria bacterium]
MAILTGFVLGSAVSITFSMFVVALLLIIVVSDYPQVEGEIRPLLRIAALFLCLTITAGLSFIGLLRQRPWWWIAQLTMWLSIAVIVLYFIR